ncbi:MAG: hypothetical protein VCC01_11255, partial [Candidatus Hydrogenedentota bacterium]
MDELAVVEIDEIEASYLGVHEQIQEDQSGGYREMILHGWFLAGISWQCDRNLQFFYSNVTERDSIAVILEFDEAVAHPVYEY